MRRLGRLCGKLAWVWLAIGLGLGLGLNQTGAADIPAIQGQDDAGHPYALKHTAQRIVSLSPNLTELIYAAGAGNKLVGVSAFSDYPEAARRLPVISDFARVDLEVIISLRPDLVLAWQSGNSRADVRRLEQLGIPVISLEARQLDDVARHIIVIGQLAGTNAAAQAEAAHYRRTLTALSARYQQRPTIRVFYEIWHQPLMTVGETQLISHALAICGAQNIFADLSGLTPSVSEEALLVRKPQLILVGGSAQEGQQRVAAWRAQPVFGPRIARGEMALQFMDADLLQRATPRLLQGVQALCASLDTLRH